MAIEFTHSGGVGTLTLAQPDRLNPMNDAAWSAIDELVAAFPPSVRAIVVTGAGRVFSAGGDINRMRAVLDSGMSEADFRAAEIARLRRIGGILMRLIRLPIMRVAAVNRCAVGAGLSLACACDYRIVSKDGFFDTSFARVGLPGDTGISYFLPRLIGAARAREWLLRPRRVTAEDALRLGLVDEVVPAPELVDRARTVASEYAVASVAATDWIRRLVPDEDGLDEALDLEAQATVACKMSEFHRAAVTDFLAKSAR